MRGLEPRRTGQALAFGTMIHQALERWYIPGTKRGQHPAEAFLEIYDAQDLDLVQWDEDGEKISARDLGWVMLTGYVEKYGTDSHLDVFQPEMTFEIDVRLRDGTDLGVYVGKIDGVARNRQTGRLVLLEHKSAKTIQFVRINSGYGEQGLSYWWAANMWLRHIGELRSDELIDSVLYNFLRKGLPDSRPTNAAGHRLNKPKKEALQAKCEELGLDTKGTIDTLTARLEHAGVDVVQLGEPSVKQPSPLFERQELLLGHNQLRTFERRIRMEMFEMGQVREGKQPVYKNPTRDCDWDCPFRDTCEVHEIGGDWEGMLDLDFKAWDPYSEHELEDERQ